MPGNEMQFHLNDASETAQFAVVLGARLMPGDTILLRGPVGAGKTHFARALIQSRQDPPEDVPSPTFTLVQTYECASGEIWHADLYRLGAPDEIVELGLWDAFEQAICLVEWPDRLGRDAPADALDLSLEYGDTPDARRVKLRWRDPKWRDKLAGVRP